MNFNEYLQYILEKVIKVAVIRDGKKDFVYKSDRDGYKVINKDGELPIEVKETQKEKINREKGQRIARPKIQAKEPNSQQKRLKSIDKRSSTLEK